MILLDKLYDNMSQAIQSLPRNITPDEVQVVLDVVYEGIYEDEVERMANNAREHFESGV